MTEWVIGYVAIGFVILGVALVYDFREELASAALMLAYIVVAVVLWPAVLGFELWWRLRRRSAKRVAP